MSHSIKTLYVVHHSHTDIGYTDLQSGWCKARSTTSAARCS